ncbi:MAG: hypothetical protein CMF50_05130 [Legionellales bacterium]|nr:hypothetical protein [Legionellales bacterium]
MSFNFRKQKDIQKPRTKQALVKRNVPKIQWYILSAIIASPLIYFVFDFLSESYIVSAPGFVTFDTVSVRAPGQGYIANIDVKEGQSVAKNQTLLEFSSPQIDHRIALLEQEIKTLEELKANTVNKELAHFEEMSDEAKRSIVKSQKHVDTLEKHRKNGLVNIFDLNDAREELHAAKIQLSDIQRKMRESQHKFKFSIENNYDDKIRKTQHEISQLNEQKQAFSIKAPANLTVINVLAYPGEYVTNGTKLMNLATDKNFSFRAFLKGKHMSDVKKDQVVTVMFPDKTKVKGIVYNTPKFVGDLPTETSLLKSEDKKVVLMIKPTQEVPKKYQIYGISVKVTI